MNSRARAAVQTVGGFGVSVALLVGIPVLLVMVAGNPLPASVPSVEEAVETLTQSGSGFSDFLIGGLAILLWCLWTQIVIAFVVELVATTRRRQTRRLPTLPGIQVLAARLVASMTLASTLATVPVFAPAAGALNFAQLDSAVLIDTSESVVTGAVVEEEAAQVDSPAFETGAVPHAPAVHLRITRSTELWDIAESVFGDGTAWKQIAQANVGRVDSGGTTITTETETAPSETVLVLLDVADPASVDPFGTIVTPERADQSASAPVGRIYDDNYADEGPGPGDIIDLGSDRDDPFAAPAQFADDLRIVESGDTIWNLAEEVVEQRDGRDATAAEVVPYWSEVVDANRDRVRSGDVDLIYPGEELILPSAREVEADVDPGHADTPRTDAATEAEVPVTGAFDGLLSAAALTNNAVEQAIANAASEPTPGSDDSATSADEPASLGASSGIVPAESNAASTAASPTVAPPSDRRVVERPTSAPTPIHDRSLPLAPVGLVAFGSAMIAASVVVALRHRRALQKRQRPEGEIPIRPSTAAAAFEAALVHSSSAVIESQQGAGWRMLPASVVETVTAVGQHELHIAPAGAVTAVPLGQGDGSKLAPVSMADTAPDADPGVLHDSEHYGSASIVVGTNLTTGDALLLDLGSSGAIEVDGEAASVRRFVRTAMLDLAVSNRADDLLIIGVGTGAELQDLERVRWVASFADALSHTVRCGHAGPSRTPVIVIASEAPPDDEHIVEALRELNALVLAPGIDAPVRVAISGDRASIWPDGSTVLLSALSDESYAAAAELVDCSAVSATEVIAATATNDTGLDVVTASDCPTEKGPIDVQVLGPVVIDGAAPFASLKATDVIAYLAFHRNGADADQIKAWVWPAYDPPSDKALANVLSRARTGLGANAAGEPYVSRAGSDRTYRLDESVTTDFDRFRGFVALANNAPDDGQALKHLQRALELIRGVPFSGGSASSFAWADNHVRAHIEFTIDEAVHRCADLALAMGELETARWAARKGLELVPGCEQCFRRRFLVAGADQNRTELRRAMADLERSASADLGEPEAVDAISNELLDLYQQLDGELVAGAS